MNNDSDKGDKEKFINPKSKFYGEFTPKNLIFNDNLQEFANKVSIICSLETNGKVSSQEAYRRIKKLWKELKNSKKQLLDD